MSGPYRVVAKGAYLPTLDGWRGVAISGVLLCHATHTLIGLGLHSPRVFIAISWLRLGVDLFFAISGFLICNRLLLEFKSTQAISLKKFYARRAFRILPLYFSYLIVLLILAGIASVPVSGAELKSGFLFYRNYANPPEGGYTYHFWSLAVEEHFYFIWPLLLVSIGPTAACWLTPIIALLVHGWRALDARFQFVEHSFPHSSPLWRTDTRLDALLWGCFAAMMFARYPMRFPAWSPFAILFALVIGIFVHVPMQPLFLALIFPLLILSTVSNPNGILSRALECAPLRWLGQLSFSLYVWQTLFLQTSVSPDPAWLSKLKQWPLNLLMIFLLSFISHYLLEQPMIRLGRRCLSHTRDRVAV